MLQSLQFSINIKNADMNLFVQICTNKNSSDRFGIFENYKSIATQVHMVKTIALAAIF